LISFSWYKFFTVVLELNMSKERNLSETAALEPAVKEGLRVAEEGVVI
jgi:hypothetical protein